MSDTAYTEPLRMSADAFIAWNLAQPKQHRYELEKGVVVELMGQDRVAHNVAKAETWRVFSDAVRKAGLACRAFVDGIAVVIPGDTVRIPDVLVNCGPISADASRAPNPVIIVEVDSPGRQERTPEQKLPEYAGVLVMAHYLCLYPAERRLVHHARTAPDTFDTRILREGVLSLDPPGLTVQIEDLFGDAPDQPEEAGDA